MSVLIECFSVVVQRSEIDSSYPGGLAGYEADCPNATFCADEHLVRVGFMAPRDIGGFLLRVLARARLASSPTGRIEDVTMSAASVAVVEQRRGPWHPDKASWLGFARRADGVSLCWLAGEPPGELAAPRGWEPAHSRSYIQLTDEQVASSPVEGRAGADGVTLYCGEAYGRATEPGGGDPGHQPARR
jgi:hypothetical protein